jgi:hypothetical protein
MVTSSGNVPTLRRLLEDLRQLAARADIGSALAILDKAPNVPPEMGDEIQEMQDHGPLRGR